MEKMARYGKTVKAIIYHFHKILAIKKTSLNKARCAILQVRWSKEGDIECHELNFEIVFLCSTWPRWSTVYTSFIIQPQAASKDEYTPHPPQVHYPAIS